MNPKDRVTHLYFAALVASLFSLLIVGQGFAGGNLNPNCEDVGCGARVAGPKTCTQGGGTVCIPANSALCTCSFTAAYNTCYCEQL